MDKCHLLPDISSGIVISSKRVNNSTTTPEVSPAMFELMDSTHPWSFVCESLPHHWNLLTRGTQRTFENKAV